MKKLKSEIQIDATFVGMWRWNDERFDKNYAFLSNGRQK